MQKSIFKFLLIPLVISITHILAGCATVYPDRLGATRVECQDSESTNQSEISVEANSTYEQFPLDIDNYRDVFVLKKRDEPVFVAFPNHVKTGNVELVRYNKQFLMFSWIIGGKLRVELIVNEGNKKHDKVIDEIKRRFPNATFSRPWMSRVRVIPTSPWINDSTFVEDCRAFPLSRIFLEFELARDEVYVIENMAPNSLFLSGTVFFFDKISNSYYRPAFSVSTNEIKYSEIP